MIRSVRYTAYALLFFVFISLSAFVSEGTNSIKFTSEEEDWLSLQGDRVFHIGLAPYEGIDLFVDNKEDVGYIFDMETLFEAATGLDFVVDTDKAWGEAYEGLQTGSVDVLFGANPTPERLEFMSFTESIIKYPYVLIAKRNTNIFTIGDLDQGKVGFIDGDQVIKVFEETYYNIDHTQVMYDDPATGIHAIVNGEVDGFITAKTEIIDDILYKNQDLEVVGDLKDATSDMTFSTLKNQEILSEILGKIMAENAEYIEEKVQDARVIYYRQILDLSQAERAWLESEPILKVGIAQNYLPIEYLDEDGVYQGVAGVYMRAIATKIGLEMEPVFKPFDDLYAMLLEGKIDIANIARTEDRLEDFIFTEPFSEERDMIFGHKSEEPIYDIYNLDGKRIAVIEGYWHEEYLTKNLRDVQIIFTESISESLKLVSEGKVDYFLENPMIAEYYIDGLGYSDISIKGETSSDSYLYIGAQKELDAFVSIFNKASKLVDYNQARYEGLGSVPELKNIANQQLTIVIIVIVFAAFLLVLVLLNLYRKYVHQQAETRVLKEKEHLMYTDALTDIYNRLHFNALELKMNKKAFPQSFIMMDLNYLKRTNDTHGHYAGDQLLKKFAEILKDHFDHDNIMRMGGDEFFVFLEGTDEEMTIGYINQLIKACQSATINIGNGQEISGPVTSYGYAIRHSQDELVEDVLHKADMAMYNEKMKNR